MGSDLLELCRHIENAGVLWQFTDEDVIIVEYDEDDIEADGQETFIHSLTEDCWDDL